MLDVKIDGIKEVQDKLNKMTKTAKKSKNISHRIAISNEESRKVVDDTIYIPLKTYLFS